MIRRHLITKKYGQVILDKAYSEKTWRTVSIKIFNETKSEPTLIEGIGDQQF